MILIIDGYNLLKQIFAGAPKNMAKQRDAFIHQLGWYQKLKSESIDQIIVVFDGGPEKHATREIKSGVVVIFSGVKSSADSWIIHFVEKNKDKEIFLISMDNGLKKECAQFNVDAFSVFDFYNILQETIMATTDDIFAGQPVQQREAEKYNHTNVYNDLDEEFAQTQPHAHAGLDLLMEQTSTDIPREKLIKDDKEALKARCGKSHTLSKKEKRLISKIKKIG